MTENGENLHELVEKWRTDPERNYYTPAMRDVLDGCADELEEAIEADD